MECSAAAAVGINLPYLWASCSVLLPEQLHVWCRVSGSLSPGIVQVLHMLYLSVYPSIHLSI